ncbi:MAG: Rne/Rng family ribonuclease [Thermoanaerobaculia bacterium]|nr:Rne/Rng family ribonuclease [Thermoanaerobaculia bacterium]
MTRRMLINAQTPEELRVAVIEDNELEEFQVEVAQRGQTRGNIYRGRIANIQPSLNAAFVDYGAERHGFLARQDIVPEAYYRESGGKKRPRIDEVLDKGKPIVVQVVKEPQGQKGAALTTNLSLAGRYLVLTPFDDTIGVSRKVKNDEDRKALKELVGDLEIPEGCGVIVRTNALDRSKTTLNRDVKALTRLWNNINEEARRGSGIRLLYSDQDLVLQALRDYMDSDISEILVDDDQAYAKAEQYIQAFMPRSKTKLIRYRERTPLFSRFGIERQVDRIYLRRVDLTSGGSIIIDRTEALTAIDVNSGRSTSASSQEETAVSTNLEAAREVARQLRLRDIGGLVVVDFIDMRSKKNRQKVERETRKAMKGDKARSTVSRISRNGLLEINRQRIHQALSLRTHRTCPTCGGTGRLASPEIVGLHLVRRIEARAAKGGIAGVELVLHPEVADAVQNQRRRELSVLEDEFDIRIEIVSSSRLHPSEQRIEWIEGENARDRELAEADESKEPARIGGPRITVETPAAEGEEVPEEAEEEKAVQDQEDEEEREDEEETVKTERRGRRRGRRAAARAASSDGGQSSDGNGSSRPGRSGRSGRGSQGSRSGRSGHSGSETESGASQTAEGAS